MAGIRASPSKMERVGRFAAAWVGVDPLACAAFFLTGVMGQSFDGFFWWALDTLAFTIAITWLYLKANGNVLVAGIIPHFVINGMGAVGVWLSRPIEAVALGLVAVGIVVSNRRAFLRTPNPLQNTST
jgi:hypothetical protein